MTYKDDVADQESNVAKQVADAGKAHTLCSVQMKCYFFKAPSSRLFRAVGDQKASVKTQAASEENEDSA